MKEMSNINWKQTNGDKWVAYDENNKQITGWLHDTSRDTWYYLYSDDAATGWMKDSDGRWYYFFKEQCIDYNRQMYRGEMKTGWLQDEEKWYYLVPVSTPSMGIYKGQMLMSTTEEINGTEYTFDKSGGLNEEYSEGLSTNGAKFIESWEGFTSTWEDVGDHFWTIGIGTATSGTLGQQLYSSGVTSCTHAQAYEWLQQECQSCYNTIKSKAGNLSQNKIDALISMAYNIGASGLINSTLFKNICAGVTDANTIYNNFLAWSYCNGVVWEGLKRRRISEYNLFMNEDYTGNN